MKKQFIRFTALLLIFAGVAASCNKQPIPPEEISSKEIEFGVYYSEVYPIEGRTQIIFLDEKNLEIHKKNSIREYEYLININGSTISLHLDGSSTYSSHYFNLISRKEFKIGNLYMAPLGDPTEPTIIMTFEKNNAD